MSENRFKRVVHRFHPPDQDPGLAHDFRELTVGDLGVFGDELQSSLPDEPDFPDVWPLHQGGGDPTRLVGVDQDPVRGWIIRWKEYTHRGTVRGYGQICERPYAWLED